MKKEIASILATGLKLIALSVLVNACSQEPEPQSGNLLLSGEDLELSNYTVLTNDRGSWIVFSSKGLAFDSQLGTFVGNGNYIALQVNVPLVENKRYSFAYQSPERDALQWFSVQKNVNLSPGNTCSDQNGSSGIITCNDIFLITPSQYSGYLSTGFLELSHNLNSARFELNGTTLGKQFNPEVTIKGNFTGRPLIVHK